MTELIDPKALKEYIDDCKYCDNCPKKGMRCVEDCELPDFLTAQWERIIDEQPIIEAEPVRHGRWIKRDDGRVRPFWDSYRCSECLITSSYSPFCPNCGAKMDGGEE